MFLGFCHTSHVLISRIPANANRKRPPRMLISRIPADANQILTVSGPVTLYRHPTLAAVLDRNLANQNSMQNATIKAISTFLFSLFPFSFLLAQQEDADFMRSMGKMYVVVAVIAAIFIGIVIFLIYLDRKLTKLEHQIKNHD